MTPGGKFVADNCPADDQPWSRPRAADLADAIDDALRAAGRRGFEQAVAGGKELRGAVSRIGHPVVLYFDTKEMADDFVNMTRTIMPDMESVAVERRDQ